MSSSAPVHSVHFYQSHDSLIERLCGVVASGLVIGNSVLICCTEEHRLKLIKSLERLEIDVRAYTRMGRFTICDAAELLRMFMVDGMPDAKSFRASVGRLIGEAKQASRSKDHGLTIFGEMVAVLWESGNKAGALALEQQWNLVMHSAAFHLHCAYPGWLFAQNGPEMQEICQAHSHILGTAPAA